MHLFTRILTKKGKLKPKKTKIKQNMEINHGIM